MRWWHKEQEVIKSTKHGTHCPCTHVRRFIARPCWVRRVTPDSIGGRPPLTAPDQKPAWHGFWPPFCGLSGQRWNTLLTCSPEPVGKGVHGSETTLVTRTIYKRARYNNFISLEVPDDRLSLLLGGKEDLQSSTDTQNVELRVHFA